MSAPCWLRRLEPIPHIAKSSSSSAGTERHMSTSVRLWQTTQGSLKPSSFARALFHSRYQKRNFMRIRLRLKIEAVVQRQLDEMRQLLRRKAVYEAGMSGGLVPASAMKYVVRAHYPDKDASQAQIDLEFERREKRKKETLERMKQGLPAP